MQSLGIQTNDQFDVNYILSHGLITVLTEGDLQTGVSHSME